MHGSSVSRPILLPGSRPGGAVARLRLLARPCAISHDHVTRTTQTKPSVPSPMHDSCLRRASPRGRPRWQLRTGLRESGARRRCHRTGRNVHLDVHYCVPRATRPGHVLLSVAVVKCTLTETRDGDRPGGNTCHGVGRRLMVFRRRSAYRFTSLWQCFISGMLILSCLSSLAPGRISARCVESHVSS